MPGTVPDGDGWYPAYLPVPQHLAPERAAAPEPTSGGKKVLLDVSWFAIVSHWRLVLADLADRGIDLYDPAVLGRPWPGIRNIIFSLLDAPLGPFDAPSRLRTALTRKG